MPRDYRMGERAKAQDETRERIVRATMSLHDEQGVAATSFVDVAKRAGVGAATVYRHFPAIGDLVMACGAHVWAEMRPPVPTDAAAVFAGVEGLANRLARLVDELDAFYRRGDLRLGKAAADRAVIPELHGFLSAVEVGISALAATALEPWPELQGHLPVVLALTDFPVWRSLQRLDQPASEVSALQVRLLLAALHRA
ncbi:MAG: TetR/AcrR family transcriptional regulator [Devosia sp.]